MAVAAVVAVERGGALADDTGEAEILERRNENDWKMIEEDVLML